MTNLDNAFRRKYSAKDELRLNSDPAVVTLDPPRYGWLEIRGAQGETLDVDWHAAAVIGRAS